MCIHILPEPSLLQTAQSQLSQPHFTREMLQFLYYLWTSLWTCSCTRLASVPAHLSCSGEPRKGTSNLGVSGNMLHSVDQDLSDSTSQTVGWPCNDIRHLPQHSWVQSTKDEYKSDLFKSFLMWVSSSTKSKPFWLQTSCVVSGTWDFQRLTLTDSTKGIEYLPSIFVTRFSALFSRRSTFP